MDHPSPSDIRDARAAAGLTQTEAAAVIGYSLRGWQDLEAGLGRINSVLWAAWRIRVGLDAPESILTA
jgi:DNA-binding XRE family transcriptional regulator